MYPIPPSKSRQRTAVSIRSSRSRMSSSWAAIDAVASAVECGDSFWEVVPPADDACSVEDVGLAKDVGSREDLGVAVWGVVAPV